MNTTFRTASYSAFLVIVLNASIGVSDEPKNPAISGELMQTLFSPVIAAEPKAMAVLQRTSLLDQVTRSKALQLALVVDGTESMAPQLAAIQKQLKGMVRDLTAVLKEQLSIQLVVYRDVGAAHVIEFPLEQNGNAFTNDSDAIDAGLAKLLPKSGAPYFLEQVDAGLYAAISQLRWSTDASVSRWILLIGDAPPFDEGFHDATGAERKHTDEQIILLAKDRGITIHSLLCPTRIEDQVIYDEVLPKTRDFFGKMAENTGGTCFDLSDKKFQSEIQAAAKRAAIEYIPIDPISLDDIERMANSAPKLAEAKSNRAMRIAVLPFMPKQAESAAKGIDLFSAAKNETVLLASQISSQLGQIGAQPVASSKIKKEVSTALNRELRQELLAKSVGENVGADYVLCVFKNAAINDKIQYDYALLETIGGTYVVKPVSVDSKVRKDSEASNALLVQIAQVTKSLAPPSDLRSLMAKLTPNPAGKARNVSLAETSEIENLIVKARLALDGVVDFEMISANDAALFEIGKALTDAEKFVDEALAVEKENSTACLIAANIRIARIILNPQASECSKWRREAILYLDAAKRNANKDATYEVLEIEADSAMIIAKYSVAAEKYQSILKSSDESAKLRARWMLMGLHSGDWEANRFSKELVDPAKARTYALEILAFHPESTHAKKLRQILQISNRSPESASPNLPIKNKVGFSGTISN